jgi:hypothetical protein
MEELIKRIQRIYDVRKTQGRIKFYMSESEIDNLKKEGYSERDIETAVRSLWSHMNFGFDEKQNLVSVKGDMVNNKE